MERPLIIILYNGRNFSSNLSGGCRLLWRYLHPWQCHHNTFDPFLTSQLVTCPHDSNSCRIFFPAVCMYCFMLHLTLINRPLHFLFLHLLSDQFYADPHSTMSIIPHTIRPFIKVQVSVYNAVAAPIIHIQRKVPPNSNKPLLLPGCTWSKKNCRLSALFISQISPMATNKQVLVWFRRNSYRSHRSASQCVAVADDQDAQYFQRLQHHHGQPNLSHPVKNRVLKLPNRLWVFIVIQTKSRRIKIFQPAVWKSQLHRLQRLTEFKFKNIFYLDIRSERDQVRDIFLICEDRLSHQQ